MTDSNTCQQAIQKAAEDVDQMVVGNTQKLILTGGLCSVSSVGARILLQPQNARLSLAVAQVCQAFDLVKKKQMKKTTTKNNGVWMCVSLSLCGHVCACTHPHLLYVCIHRCDTQKFHLIVLVAFKTIEA